MKRCPLYRRSGHTGAATMCLADNCNSGYDKLPLTCFRQYASYGKSCTYSTLDCDPIGCHSVSDCFWRGRCGCWGGGNCRWNTHNNNCNSGYYDAGCFCARDAHSYDRWYDRGVGDFPSTRTKRTVTMATLPIFSFPS